ncbi:MAG: hypothetical protein ACP5NW_00240 [Candidatus Woesearchaeota archaeon]
MIILSFGVLIGAISYTLHKDNYYKNRVIEYRIIDTYVEVVENGAGLNGDRDALRFGKIGPGSSGNRFIDINSTSNAIIEIYVAGDMAQFLSIDTNKISVSPGEDKQIPVYISIPKGTPYGNYSGKIHVVMLKP